MNRASDEGSGSEMSARSDTNPALQSIRPSDVPMYLRESEFYKSLSIDDDEKFYIPVDHMKVNSNVVDTLEDACDLLRTARFWGVEVDLLPVVNFALTQSFDELESLSSFANEFDLVENLLYILDARNPLKKRMEAAMEEGVLALVQRVDKGGEMVFSQRALTSAAANGSLDCLQYALSKKWRCNNPFSLYGAAVSSGNIECVKLLDQQKQLARSEHTYSYAEKKTLTGVAAENGQYDMLLFLVDKGYTLAHSLESAAAGGDLACLMHIVNKRANVFGLEERRKACLNAALNGHVDCLKYLHQVGCQMSKDVCIEAATAGSLGCLQFYCEQGGTWDFLATHAAALNGHLDCLRYAYENGCGLVSSHENINAACEDRHSYVGRDYRYRFGVKEGPAHLVEMVAQREHWGCVLYLIAQHYPLTIGLSELLARKHKDNILVLAIERGCPVATVAGIRLAKIGNLEGLQLALDRGCYLSTEILCAAARRGHLQCLQLARERGCPWSKNVCVAAARGGHLDCLQYAREHGCPWDGRVRQEKRHPEIVKYAKDRNCPVLVKSDVVKNKSGKRKRASYMW